MSLSRVLNIARSALLVQQRSMGVTANNIANASTPGYTRQRLAVQSMGLGSLVGAAGGVYASQIERIRDPFMDISYRREASFLGSSTTTRQFLGQVEAALNEPSDSGVASALDDMFRSFSDLADDPDSGVQREEVRRSAERFIHHLGRLSQSITDAITQAGDRMRSEVDEVNSITAKIASLNETIRIEERTIGATPELLDQRDQLLDRLSDLVAIQVDEAEDGTVSVSTEGLTLVSGAMQQDLAVKGMAGGGFGIGLASMTEGLRPQGGSLQALSDLTARTLPDYLADLDAFAQAMVTEVNALHRQGYTAAGETGVDFFDPEGITAGTISLSAAVTDSAEAIAAGQTLGAADNSMALAIAALGQQDIDSLGGQTFNGFYATFAATVGSAALNAQQDEAAALTLTGNADAWRTGVAGVSVDEEMVNLIAQQEAYSAAARLVGIADQMIQEILAVVR